MAIQFKQAEKNWNDTLVFPAFDLTISPGEVLSICTSVNIRELLIDILVGKKRLSQGNIQFSDSKLGFLFLHEGLHERLTVKESIKFYQQLYNSTESREKILHLTQLDSKKNTKIKQLTFSEKKRLQLAYILIQKPEIYILEEPDQNLDMESKRIFQTVLNELRSTSKTILILTTNLESAITFANKVYRLDDKGLYPLETKQEEEEQEVSSPPIIEEEKEEKIIQPIRFEKIPTKVNDKIVLFDPPEIDYIESTEGQTSLHIKGEKFICSFTLNELEERLLPFGFFRCHRSYIVNLQKVREVITWTRNSYSLVLEDRSKSTIPLSKTKMAELKGMLGLT